MGHLGHLHRVPDVPGRLEQEMAPNHAKAPCFEAWDETLVWKSHGINRISIGYSVLLCSLSLRILRNSRNPSKPFLQEGHKWVVVMVKIRSSRHNLVSIHRFVSTCPKETPRKPRTRRHIDCFSTLMTRKIDNTCDTWPFVPGASTVFSNLKYTRMILHDHVCFMLAGTNNFYEWQANYLTSSVL